MAFKLDVEGKTIVAFSNIQFLEELSISQSLFDDPASLLEQVEDLLTTGEATPDLITDLFTDLHRRSK